MTESQMQEPATSTALDNGGAPLEPMDPQLKNIQPGGGWVIKMELTWGKLRRRYLKTFRKRYLEKMQGLRQGESNGCPHEVLDPRDVKIYRNQEGWHWKKADDPFEWRNNLPFVREGLAELFVLGGGSFFLAGFIASLFASQDFGIAWQIAGWLISGVFSAVGFLIVWFFRNPKRKIPKDTQLVVSPADGKIVTLEEIEHDEFIEGPAMLIGIFLSIVNVHINRMPISARVIGLSYKQGKCLNALRPESARENEQLAVRIQGDQIPHRRMTIRQITGAIARRIVNWQKPGNRLQKGEIFGMIKLGSRTELIVPRDDSLELKVQLGDKVKAGSSVVASYISPESSP